MIGGTILLGVLFGLSFLPRWRTRCPRCLGTGICRESNGSLARNRRGHPHSCCGDCDRNWVPVRQVPTDYQYLLDDDSTAPTDVLIGNGSVRGNLWQRIAWGRPLTRTELGLRPSERIHS
jgi:hypothetical protein